MENKIKEIIAPITDSTGIKIGIYNLFGERALPPESDGMPQHIEVKYETLAKDKLLQDKKAGLTFFRIKAEKDFIGALPGSDISAKNYARLLTQLIESKLSESHNDINFDLRGLLLGELSRAKIEKVKIKNIDLAKHKYIILTFVTSHKSRKALTDFLQSFASSDDFIISMPDFSLVLIKRSENDGYYTLPEFVNTLASNIADEIAVKCKIGVGGIAETVEQFASVYSQALAALRLGAILDKDSALFYYNDYRLVRLIEELPQETLQKYLKQNLDKQGAVIFEDDELMSTAEQFLQGSLNISETARIMYLHRNTLIYRLDKIENATGLNIRRFADAMTFRVLSIVYKITHKNI